MNAMPMMTDIWGLFKDAGTQWMEDKAPRLGAALAYYTAFSLAPLLVIIIAVVGLVFGRDAAMGSFFGEWEASILGQILNIGVSLSVITLLFAMIYRFLPDAKIAWRDVWFGAAFTTLLFIAGKLLIGLYLGNSGTASAYGAA